MVVGGLNLLQDSTGNWYNPQGAQFQSNMAAANSQGWSGWNSADNNAPGWMGTGTRYTPVTSPSLLTPGIEQGSPQSVVNGWRPESWNTWDPTDQSNWLGMNQAKAAQMAANSAGGLSQVSQPSLLSNGPLTQMQPAPGLAETRLAAPQESDAVMTPELQAQIDKIKAGNYSNQAYAPIPAFDFGNGMSGSTQLQDAVSKTGGLNLVSDGAGGFVNSNAAANQAYMQSQLGPQGTLDYPTGLTASQASDAATQPPSWDLWDPADQQNYLNEQSAKPDWAPEGWNQMSGDQQTSWLENQHFSPPVSLPSDKSSGYASEILPDGRTFTQHDASWFTPERVAMIDANDQANMQDWYNQLSSGIGIDKLVSNDTLQSVFQALQRNLSASGNSAPAMEALNQSKQMLSDVFGGGKVTWSTTPEQLKNLMMSGRVRLDESKLKNFLGLIQAGAPIWQQINSRNTTSRTQSNPIAQQVWNQSASTSPLGSVSTDNQMSPGGFGF